MRVLCSWRRSVDLAFLPDNRLFVAGKTDQIWDPKSGELCAENSVLPKVAHVCVSKDSQILIKNTEGRMVLYDENLQPSDPWGSPSMMEGPGPVFLPDGKMLDASWRGEVVIWNVASRSIVQHANTQLVPNQLFVHGQKAILLASSRMGERVEHVVARWDWEKMPTLFDFRSLGDPFPFEVALSPSGQLLALREIDRISIFDLQAWEVIQVYPLSDSGASACVVWSHDGRLLCTGTAEGFVVLSSETGETLEKFEQPYSSCCAFSSDDKFLAIGGWTFSRLIEV